MSLSKESKPQLAYWDMRALGEQIRLLLRYLEVDFEDIRYPLGKGEDAFKAEQWTNKKYDLGLDFPNLPYYIEEDVKLTQSMAIMQHIGRKHNLCGDTLQEKAIIDMVAGLTYDLRNQAWHVYHDTNFHAIKEDWKKTIPSRLGEMNKFLDGKKFVLGEKISYVDFMVYESMECFRAFVPDMFEQSEELANLNGFQKRIENLPQIKTYMESGKFKYFPIFAPFVYFGHSKDPEFKPARSFRNFVANYPLEK